MANKALRPLSCDNSQNGTGYEGKEKRGCYQENRGGKVVQDQISHGDTVGKRDSKIPSHHFPDMSMKLGKEILIKPVVRPEFRHQFRSCTTHVPNHCCHRITGGYVDQHEIQHNNGEQKH